jgi:hypothetical protein
MRVRTSDGSVTVEFKVVRTCKKTSCRHKAKSATVAFVEGAQGVAYLSRKDNDDPFLGRKLALQRALAASDLTENERLKVWVAFFARELEQERAKTKKGKEDVHSMYHGRVFFVDRKTGEKEPMRHPDGRVAVIGKTI